MGCNYYMVLVKSIVFGKEEMYVSQIAEALITEQIWLFCRNMPNMQLLQGGDKLLICGEMDGEDCFLGHFTLKTTPSGRTYTPICELVENLIKSFSLSADIIDEVLWDDPKPIRMFFPNLNSEGHSLHFKRGLTQLSQEDYERIVGVADESHKDTLVIEEKAHYIVRPPSPELNKETAATQLLQKTDLDEIYNETLNDVRQLMHLLQSEIPKWIPSFQNLIVQGERIPQLEYKLSLSNNLLEEQTKSVILLQEENERQAKEIFQLTQTQDKLVKEREKIKREYEERLQLLKQERQELEDQLSKMKAEAEKQDQALVQMRGIKEVLQRISDAFKGRDKNTPTAN